MHHHSSQVSGTKAVRPVRLEDVAGKERGAAARAVRASQAAALAASAERAWRVTGLRGSQRRVAPIAGERPLQLGTEQDHIVGIRRYAVGLHAR